jgi:hypothetical protein
MVRCGMLTAHRLGHGSTNTMNQAGARLLTELRTHGTVRGTLTKMLAAAATLAGHTAVQSALW